MTTFILLRHAKSTANTAGVLAGRTPGVELTKQGMKDAQRLIKILNELEIDRIISSPLERCVATVSPFAATIKKRITLEKSFVEMDYGTWSGRSLQELQKLPSWKIVQKNPKSFTFPQGESFRKALSRVSKNMEELAKKYPNDRVLIVTHGDIIKLITSHALGLDINGFQRIVVDPSSISVIEWNGKDKKVLQQNFLPSGKVALASKKMKQNIKKRSSLGGGAGV